MNRKLVDDMWQKSYDNSPSLYLIATPIGNMEDMTIRSIHLLKDLEVLFCEDTRVTQLLLQHYGIRNKKLISLHDHNEDVVKEKVIYFLKLGQSVGLVTDRGTPIISDPGYKTVQYVSSNGFSVIALPGANAFVPALIVSGIAPQPFTFYGFLDSKDSKRRKELESLKYVDHSLIFYEAPHRILKTMQVMLEIFGDREVSLSREISKRFESVYRGNISALLPTLENIKGEFVVVVSGYQGEVIDHESLDIFEKVNLYISNGLDTMSAIKLVASLYHLKKSDVYAIYHKENKK